MVSKKERKRRARKIPDWYLRGMISGSKPREFLAHLALMIWQTWVTLLLLGGLLVGRRLSAQPFGLWDWFLIVLLILPLLLSLIPFITSNVETKAGMLAVRAQWEQLLWYLPKYYKAVSKGLGEPRAELATRTWNGKALVKLDRADEAIEQLEPLREMDGLSEADYLMARVQVLMAMDDYELAREEAQMLLESEPDRVEGWGAICELESLFFSNPQGARLALDHAVTLKTWKNLGPAGDYLHGITLAAEDEHAQALDRLRPFRRWAKAFGSQVPTAWQLWAAAGCVMAESHQALGEHDTADQILSDTRTELQQLGLLGALENFETYLHRQSRLESAHTDQPSPSE